MFPDETETTSNLGRWSLWVAVALVALVSLAYWGADPGLPTIVYPDLGVSRIEVVPDSRFVAGFEIVSPERTLNELIAPVSPMHMHGFWE